MNKREGMKVNEKNKDLQQFQDIIEGIEAKGAIPPGNITLPPGIPLPPGSPTGP